MNLFGLKKKIDNNRQVAHDGAMEKLTALCAVNNRLHEADKAVESVLRERAKLQQRAKGLREEADRLVYLADGHCEAFTGPVDSWGIRNTPCKNKAKEYGLCGLHLSEAKKHNATERAATER